MFQEISLYIEQHRYLQILITFALSLFVSLKSIPVIITISRLKNLMDIPGDRSSHNKKTPTLGGVAIFASILIGYFIWPNKDGGAVVNLTIVSIVTLFFLGVKDDILILSPAKKMVLQIACSALLIIGGDLRIGHFFGIFGVNQLPYLISLALTILIFIALINAMNLIDGIDGLAGGIGFIASFIFGYWFYKNENYALACLAGSVCGALVGFLKYNFSKTSKIFMGDTGSLILGFLLTMFSITFINLNLSANSKLGHIGSAPIIAVTILIIPIFDTLRVFLVRILNKKSPFEGDRIHLHHILIDLGLSHKIASFSLCLVTVVVSGFFIYFRFMFSNTQSFFVLLGLFFVYLLSCHLLQTKLDANNLVLANNGNEEIVDSKLKNYLPSKN